MRQPEALNPKPHGLGSWISGLYKVYMRIYKDNGKENGNHYLGLRGSS